MAALTALVQSFWGKYSAGWKGPDIAFRGLVTFALLLFVFDKIWGEPESKTVIRQWLEKTTFSINTGRKNNDEFRFTITDSSGRIIEIFKPKNSGADEKDASVVILSAVNIHPEMQKQIQSLSLTDQEILLSDLKLALLIIGVEFDIPVRPFQRIVLSSTFISTSTITNSELSDRILRVTRGLVYIQERLNRELTIKTQSH